MRGECIGCPVEMDPPKISVQILDLDNGVSFGNFCKWDCAKAHLEKLGDHMVNGGSFKDIPIESREIVYEVRDTTADGKPVDLDYDESGLQSSRTLAADLSERLADDYEMDRTVDDVEKTTANGHNYKVLEAKHSVGQKKLTITHDDSNVNLVFPANELLNITLETSSFDVKKFYAQVAGHVKKALEL